MFFGSSPQKSTLVGLTAKEALEHCLNLHDHFLNDYQKAGERLLDDVQRQLDEFVVLFNVEIKKVASVKQNKVGFRSYNLNPSLRLAIIVIMTDIYTLTLMGRIKNDEYNGLSYGYKS